jgi:hypothetical protein
MYRGMSPTQSRQWTFPRSLMLLSAQLYGVRQAAPTTSWAIMNCTAPTIHATAPILVANGSRMIFPLRSLEGSRSAHQGTPAESTTSSHRVEVWPDPPRRVRPAGWAGTGRRTSVVGVPTPQPRNPLEAIGRRRFLLTGWPWRSLGYLLTTLPLALGASLPLAVLGLPWVALVRRMVDGLGQPIGTLAILALLSGVLVATLGPLVALPVAALERRRLGWWTTGPSGPGTAGRPAPDHVLRAELVGPDQHRPRQRRQQRGRDVSQRGDLVVIEINDNGHGGADPRRGSGLTGLADRVAVPNGRMLLSSPTGGPTLLRVEIPCNQSNDVPSG